MTVKLNPREEDERVPAGTPIPLSTGRVADTEAHMADFLAAVTRNAGLNGRPLIAANDYGGPIEPYPDLGYISRWRYPLGVLNAGT